MSAEEAQAFGTLRHDGRRRQVDRGAIHTNVKELKAEPEDSWDLMWNTTLIYSLFPNTILMVQGDHVLLGDQGCPKLH